MLWVRGVNDRLEKLAPFLSYDADPYPVAIDGRAVWVTDAYTTTSSYPYGQRVGDVQRSPRSGLSDNDNYVRNSVKAVVDAYSGEVTFYVVDDQDPILSAWRGAFPDLFTPLSEMPEELQDNLRYPEDLFRIQTDVYSKYRIDPALFFQRDGNAWSVAQAPGTEPSATSTGVVVAPAPNANSTAAQNTFATESDSERFTPYYTMFDNGVEGERGDESFVILRPFVPFSTGDERTQLQSYMTASSDPESYGKLITYFVEERNGTLPDGPLRVANNAESTEAISRRISLDNVGDGGTEVRFGDLQLIPVSDGLVYVRPYYVSSPQASGDISSVTEYRGVIVTYNERSVLEPTIGEALARLFPGFDADVGDVVDRPTDPESGDPIDPQAPDDPDDPVDPDEPGSDVGDGSAGDLLAAADQAFADADVALADGDLGEYQAKIDEARQYIADAVALLDQP